MDETQVDQPREPDAPVTTSGRGPLTWLVAGLAAVVIVVVCAVALLGGDDAEVPLADETGLAGEQGDEAADDQPSVTRLESGEEPGRCMLPTAEALAEQPLAFEGAVVGVDDGVAVLEPTEFFAGRATDRVEVAAPSDSDRALLGSVALEEGVRYLAAASEGRVVGCGLSGPAEADLTELYAEAFHR